MKKIFFTVLLFFITTLLCAFGGREKEKEAAPKIVQVTGTVRLVGTSLFPEIVISSPDEGDWYVAAGERDKLHDLLHRTVTVEAEETVTELTFANGMSAGVRRELKSIRLINLID